MAGVGRLEPNVIWCYDFTHFSAARRVAIALLDVVSRL
jgi:putative transposase